MNDLLEERDAGKINRNLNYGEDNVRESVPVLKSDRY